MTKIRAKLKNHTKRVTREIRAGVDQNAAAAATEFQGDLKRTLRGQRSGEQYRVSAGSTRTYTASAPGEPPAVATGRLLNSVDAQPVGNARWLVGTPLKYGRYLELGTVHMRPRPWFRSTGKENASKYRRILGRKATR